MCRHGCISTITYAVCVQPHLLVQWPILLEHVVADECCCIVVVSRPATHTAMVRHCPRGTNNSENIKHTLGIKVSIMNKYPTSTEQNNAFRCAAIIVAAGIGSRATDHNDSSFNKSSSTNTSLTNPSSKSRQNYDRANHEFTNSNIHHHNLSWSSIQHGAWIFHGRIV